MKSSLVLCWRLNKRLIVLEDETHGQTIGLVRRDGSTGFVKWLGFADLEYAKSLKGARPVKLVVARIGVKDGFNTLWTDLNPEQFVQGCLVDTGVFAIVNSTIRVI